MSEKEIRRSMQCDCYIVDGIHFEKREDAEQAALAAEIRANTTPEEMALRLKAAANVFTDIPGSVRGTMRGAAAMLRKLAEEGR